MEVLRCLRDLLSRSGMVQADTYTHDLIKVVRREFQRNFSSDNYRTQVILHGGSVAKIGIVGGLSPQTLHTRARMFIMVRALLVACYSIYISLHTVLCLISCL